MCYIWGDGGGGGGGGGRCHEYVEGCCVHRKDTMIRMGDILIHGRGYYECIGGCSAHPGFSIQIK